MSLATIAAKNGKIIGNILAGKKYYFPRAIGTSIMQVFESEIARTGYIKEQAILNGFNVKEVAVNGTDHTHYVADANQQQLKLFMTKNLELLLAHKFLVIINLV